MAPTLSIVIPCYNEEKSVRPVLHRIIELKRALPRQDIEVLVVNDGSQDRTAAELQSFPWVKVIAHSRSQGYGAAIKSGLRACQGDWIGILDMDGTYDPLDFAWVLERINREDADLYQGTRMGKGSRMPFLRRAGNRFYSFLLTVFFHSPLEDVCTGLRVFRRELAAEALALPHDGLDFSIALTLRTLSAGYRIREFNICYEERLGESKLSEFRDGVRFLRVILHELKFEFMRKLVAPGIRAARQFLFLLVLFFSPIAEARGEIFAQQRSCAGSLRRNLLAYTPVEKLPRSNSCRDRESALSLR
jgi:glycosyltransferase involved in cell wall biosynthesis